MAISQTTGGWVPSDTGHLGGTSSDDQPTITMSRRSEKQPGQLKYTSTNNADRGYVPSYANMLYFATTFSVTADYTFTEQPRTVDGSESRSSNHGPAWSPEFDQADEVPGKAISGGQYTSSNAGNNPHNSAILSEFDIVTGELSDIRLYGIYTGDNTDNTYSGANWEPCGRYVVNTENKLTQWTGERSVSDWTAGGLAAVGIDQNITYNNSAGSMVVSNSAAGNGSAYQAALVNAQDYKVTGYAYKPTGGSTPRVLSGTDVLWTYSGTGDAWEYFDVDFTANTANIYFQCVSTAGFAPVYFDQLRVTDANDTTGWTPFSANRSCSAFLMRSQLADNMNCVTARTMNAWSIPV